MPIYLIGGPPKCGKTTLAKKLSKEFTIPWISADTLENIVAAYTPKESKPTLFPHSYLRGESNDEFYSLHSPQAIVDGYVAQSKATYSAIGAIVETQLSDKDDYIIEGYQVTPEIVNQIIYKLGPDTIKSIFLIKKDKEKFISDVHKSTTLNDWILRKTKNEETFLKIAEMVRTYSNYFETEAKKYNFSLLEMDSDFDEKLEQAVHYFKP
jgi:2-phosphoglycerate kinase